MFLLGVCQDRTAIPQHDPCPIAVNFGRSEGLIAEQREAEPPKSRQVDPTQKRDRKRCTVRTCCSEEEAGRLLI